MTTRPESGFTLIEVLAALLIFSIAIIGLTSAGTHSARTVTAMDQKMLAGIVADNVLTDARYERLQVGTRSGRQAQMSREFEWELLTQSTDVEDFWRMTVSVRLENADQVLIQRSAYRASDPASSRASIRNTQAGGDE